MSERHLIDDGYTIAGKIDRYPGIYPELRFTYRPVLSERRNRYLRDAQDVEKIVRHRADLISEHVVSWDIRDASGNELPKKYDTVRKLQPLLLDRMIEIIMGYSSNGEEATDEKNS